MSEAAQPQQPPRVPLQDQIAELEREARYRRSVAQQLEARGLREPKQAAGQDAALAAAIVTLKWLRDNETAIKAAIAEAKKARA